MLTFYKEKAAFFQKVDLALWNASQQSYQRIFQLPSVGKEADHKTVKGLVCQQFQAQAGLKQQWKE